VPDPFRHPSHDRWHDPLRDPLRDPFCDPFCEEVREVPFGQELARLRRRRGLSQQRLCILP